MNFVTKTEELFKGSVGDFSKIVKVMQYVCVLTSEFGAYRYHLRGIGVPKMADGVIGGNLLSADQDEVLRLKWKKLGSCFSTARMTLRFGDFIYEIKFFVSKFKDACKGKLRLKDESFLDWTIQFFDLIGGICDNWVFLDKIKVMPFTARW